MPKRPQEVSDSEDEVKYLRTEQVSEEEDEYEEGAPEYFEQAALVDLTGPDSPEYGEEPYAEDQYAEDQYAEDQYAEDQYAEDPFDYFAGGTSPEYEPSGSLEDYVPGTPDYRNDGNTTEVEESDEEDPFEGSNSGF
jgi:hypothetical protein